MKDRIFLCLKILPYVSKYKVKWIFLCILKIGQQIPLLLQPLLLKLFIDHVIIEKNIYYMKSIIILYIGLYCFETLLKVGHRIIDNILFNEIASDLRISLWDKYLHMPFCKFSQYKISDLVRRLYQDVDIIKFFLVGEVFDFLAIVLSILISLIFILRLDWRLYIVTLILIPLSLIMSKKCYNELYEFGEKGRNIVVELEERVQNQLKNWKEIRADQLEEYQKKEYKNILRKLFFYKKEEKDILFRRDIMMEVKEKIVDMLGIYVIGALLHFCCGVPVSTVITCANYYDNTICNFHDIFELDRSLIWIKPSILRIIEILEIPVEICENIDNHIVPNLLVYEIKDFALKYKGESHEIINKVNMKVKRGEKVLIDGISGSGKSTLMDFLAKDLVNKDENILFYGKSINSFSLAEIYNYIRKIDKDTYYMNISIQEFLRIAKEDASFEEMRKACIESCVGNDLMEKMLDPAFFIGENAANLSGGQRQKLAIARLFLNNNKTLLLDEAFSAIDVKDKTNIIQNLLLKYKDETIICISHDLEIKKMFKTFVDLSSMK